MRADWLTTARILCGLPTVLLKAVRWLNKRMRRENYLQYRHEINAFAEKVVITNNNKLWPCFELP